VLSLDTANGAVTGLQVVTNGARASWPIPPTTAVVLANGTIEATRLALTSLGVGDMTYGSPRLGNLMAHLRSNITVRIKRPALGLGAPSMTDVETTAILVRGEASTGRQFHFQVTAASVGGANSEQNMWQAVPDIDVLDQVLQNQNQKWVSITFRGIGEMEESHATPPDPARSWITLSGETDVDGMRRAYVKLALSDNDTKAWQEMDDAAFALAKAMAGPNAADIEYFDSKTKQWIPNPPAPEVNPATGRLWWRDSLGSTHHEAGPLFMGAPGSAVTNIDGRFHGWQNAYIAGPAAFPTLGSANPSLTALTLAHRTADVIAGTVPASPVGLAPFAQPAPVGR
jgi:choline dehydrogenase-like flavoprotein